MNITPLNTDFEGNCSCLKANYYKKGGANFLGHTKDGFKATCIMEMTNRITDLNECQTEPLRIPQATKQGYIEVPPGSLFDMSYYDGRITKFDGKPKDRIYF